MEAPPVHYRVNIRRPATHLFHVVMELDAASLPAATLDVRFPVWTPGSYLVREFARQVQDFHAVDEKDRQLPWRKTRKDTWRVEAGAGQTVRVGFNYYGNELSVRTTHVDATHAMLNPANFLPYVEGMQSAPLTVQIAAPDGWQIATSLVAVAADSVPHPSPSPVGEGADGRWTAANYDELVDSPIHIGPDAVYAFEALGRPHTLATWGRGNLDAQRLIADLTRIVEVEGELFGGLPYDRYTFLLMLSDGARGGLEHRDSCTLMVPRSAFRPGKTYERVLQLCAHEFFHTWNVKRIHPEVLGPFDYGAENYTRLLWAMEGITEYYTSVVLCRAGLISPARYLEILGEQISDLAETPGRLHQSLEEASFDAWIKYYRPDEHSSNSSVSYYLKGALASLLLDLEMRRRTGGSRSLDDLMRFLWERYGQPGVGIPEDGYQAAVTELAGSDWTGFFDHVIRGRDDLDYATALKSAGIELEWSSAAEGPIAWLGVKTKREADRTKVAGVVADGPCWDAGISAGDELLALDGLRIDEGTISDRLRDYQPGDAVTLTFFRRDELVQVPISLAARPATRARLTRLKRPTVRQRSIYEAWLGQP
ncbi:MAG: hypothetical protein HW416_3259 [Chloroflexi bacterium]|nr:hypothetical protein [Chloroflexota bacterium]